MKMRRNRGDERRVVKIVSQHQVAAMKGFHLVLFLILLCLQGVQVKAMETSSTGRQFHRERSVDQSKDTQRKSRSSPFYSSSLKEMVCCSVTHSGMRKPNTKKERNRQARDRKIRRKSQGEGALGSRCVSRRRISKTTRRMWWGESPVGEMA